MCEYICVCVGVCVCVCVCVCVRVCVCVCVTECLVSVTHNEVQYTLQHFFSCTVIIHRKSYLDYCFYILARCPAHAQEATGLSSEPKDLGNTDLDSITSITIL